MSKKSIKSSRNRGQSLISRFRAGLSRHILATMLPVAAVALFFAPVAWAGLTYSGDISPATDPSTWTSGTGGTTAYIGYNTSDGSLSINGGSTVTDNSATLGYGSGKTGAVTVDGSGSKWTNSSGLTVGGKSGAGTLAITNGSEVVTGTGFSTTLGARGSIDFGLNGGTITTGMLYASPLQLKGSGMIKTSGIVGDADLVFDASHGATQTFVKNGIIYFLTQTTGNPLGAGYLASGALSISGGAIIPSYYGYLGYNAGSSGTATVTGSGSQWNNSNRLYVGYFGNGTLNITNGGSVSNTAGTIGYQTGTAGIVNVDGTGSTWTSTSTPTLSVGSLGSGTLNITNGGYVKNAAASINNAIGTIGAVTVAGAGSKWENSGGLTICNTTTGVPNGTLKITNGGYVSNTTASIGRNNCTVTVDGASIAGGTTTPSSWVSSGTLGVIGLLNITNGGYVKNTGAGSIGKQNTNNNIVTVVGTGSKWENGGTLTFGSLSGQVTGIGSLNIGNGGAVTAVSPVTINGSSVLTIDAGGTLTVGGGTGTITNGGVIRMVAGPATANGSYTPISAGAWTTGTIQALGGGYDSTAHTVTVSPAATTNAGIDTTFDLASTQRVLVTDTATSKSVGAAFQAATSSPANLTFSATAISGTELTALTSTISKTVFSGWDFTSSGYTTGNPVYLSLFAGSGQSQSDLTVWKYDSGTSKWSKYAATDLVYDGTYANLTVTDLGSYAVSGAVTAAGVPTGVTAVAGDGQATVSFTPPASDGGSAITSYTVTSSPGDITVSGMASPITVTGLTNGSPYSFTVTATNVLGTGGASAISNTVTPGASGGVLGAPTGVAAIAGDSQAAVSFTPPTNGGGSITGYTVTSTPAGGVDSAAGSTSQYHIVTGLTNGTVYTFTVTATNAAGVSATAESNSVTPFVPVVSNGLTPDIGAPSAAIVKSGATATYTVTYNGADNITLAANDVTLNKSGTTNGQITVSGSGTANRTVSISNITGNGTLGITIVTGTATAGGGAIIATSSAPSATFTVDNTAPALTVTTLADGTITSNNTLTITGVTSDANGIQGLTVNGTAVTPDTSGAFNTAVALTTGANTITVTATDTTGNQISDSRIIVYDQTAPVITFSDPTPAAGSSTTQQTVTIIGTISEPGTVEVRLGSGAFQAANMGSDSTAFTYQAVLALGQNTIEVKATDLVNDGSKNSSTVSRTVTYDNIAPVLAITDPSGDMTTTLSGYLLSGIVSDQYASITSVDLKVDGVAVTPSPTVNNGAFQQALTFADGKNYSVTVTATDSAGNISTVQRNIIFRPLTVADPLRALQIAIGLVAQTPADSVLDVGPLVNGTPHADGVIDVSDAVTLLRRVVGLVNW